MKGENRMKIVLTAINSKFIHSNLAVRYLKAFTKDLPYECTIREFSINDRKEKILEELIGEKADVIAFSSYIWNIEYVASIARLIKLVDDSIEILIGGPEASYDSRNFLDSNDADYVIEGEGEETYKEFVQSKLQSLGKKIDTPINGLYIKKDSEILYGGKRQLMNMEKLVFPYGEEDSLDNKIVYYEASRGCPFKCAYCLSSTEHGVRFLNGERVKKELDYFIKKGVRLVKFVDRTFNCNKNFAEDIWKFIIESDTNTLFHFEISGDLLSEDEIKLLSRASRGRIQFEVGVQTTNDEVLKNIDRFVTFSDISEKVIELGKVKNIRQHLDLIAGLPGEDFSSFKKSFNDVYCIEPDELQLGFLKLLKGSKMREEAPKWEMVYSPYPPYEILRTSTLSYEEIVKIKRLEEVFDKYYNSGKFKTILKYMSALFETPFDFYMSLGTYYYERGFYNRNISSVDFYKVFVDFNRDKLNGNRKIVNEIVKYDFLMNNRKRWLPDFLTRTSNKEVESSIKENFKKQGLSIKDINSTHLEIFEIDIINFVDNGIIEEGEHYLLFNASGNCTYIEN